MEKLLLNPPVLFLILFAFCAGLESLLSRLACRNSDGQSKDSREAYACGEDVPDHLSRPDYSEFFPFALFFTIAHVATLILTTVPPETWRTLIAAFAYGGTVVVSLRILLRR